MRSSALREFTFSRVRKSPEFIPLLAYLLPRPARPFVPSQTDFWTQSLVDYYPEGLKNDVLNAIAADPDRIVPLIPYILSNISGPDPVSESQIRGATATNSNTTTRLHLGCNEDDPFIYDGPRPDPTRLYEPLPFSHRAPRAEDIPDSVPSPFKGERFYLTSQRMGAGYMGQRSDPIPAGMRRAGGVHSPPPRPHLSPGWFEHRPVRPESSFEGPNSSRRAKIHSQAEVENTHNTIAFRVDRDTYHLSIHKLFFLNSAYGFVLGTFSFLGLRMLSYSPLASLIGSLPLSMALVFIVGIPISPEENN